MFARKRLAEELKQALTMREMCCVLWATKGLAYGLTEDPLFKAIFGAVIPPNFNPHALSTDMVALGKEIHQEVIDKLKGAQVTIGVDGWTNTRHRYGVVYLPQTSCFFS